MKKLHIAPQQQDASGRALASGRLYISAPCFADEALTVMHAIPIVLDQHGLVPPIYLRDNAGSFDLSVKDSEGKLVWSMDKVTVGGRD